MAKIINSQEFDNTIESGVVVVDFSLLGVVLAKCFHQ